MADVRLLEGTITFKEGPPLGAAGESTAAGGQKQLTAEAHVRTKVGRFSAEGAIPFHPDTELERRLRSLLDLMRAEVHKHLAER